MPVCDCRGPPCAGGRSIFSHGYLAANQGDHKEVTYLHVQYLTENINIAWLQVTHVRVAVAIFPVVI